VNVLTLLGVLPLLVSVLTLLGVLPLLVSALTLLGVLPLPVSAFPLLVGVVVAEPVDPLLARDLVRGWLVPCLEPAEARDFERVLGGGAESGHRAREPAEDWRHGDIFPDCASGRYCPAPSREAAR
jgi:hypothetical protein